MSIVDGTICKKTVDGVTYGIEIIDLQRAFPSARRDLMLLHVEDDGVLPEVVTGEEGSYSLDYAQLATAMATSLTTIVKEQKKEIDTLKAEVAELKEMIHSLTLK